MESFTGKKEAHSSENHVSKGQGADLVGHGWREWGAGVKKRASGHGKMRARKGVGPGWESRSLLQTEAASIIRGGHRLEEGAERRRKKIVSRRSKRP